MPFADYLPKAVPSWLQAPVWAKWFGALGRALDAASTRAKLAVKARFPSQAPDDALQVLAGERGFPPGSPYAAGVSVEDSASLQARIASSWDRWASAGNARGLLDALWDLGYRSAQVAIVRGKLYSLDGDRQLVIEQLPQGGLGSWLLGSDRSYWSCVDVIFDPATNLPDVPEAPSDWSSGLPAEDSDEVKALKACVRRWVPAAAVARIVVVTAGRCFGHPTGLSFGTLATNGYGFSGNAVTIWNVE